MEVHKRPCHRAEGAGVAAKGAPLVALSAQRSRGEIERDLVDDAGIAAHGVTYAELPCPRGGLAVEGGQIAGRRGAVRGGEGADAVVLADVLVGVEGRPHALRARGGSGLERDGEGVAEVRVVALRAV